MNELRKKDRVLIISLEGLDTSGKSTQVELLATKLRLDGYKVKTFHFPNYESNTGKLIKECLYTGETDFIQYLYLLDQLKFFLKEEGTFRQVKPSEQFESILENFDILILDRYEMSTLAYSMASSKDCYAKYDEIIGMQKVLPKPNITFILDLPATKVQERKSILDSFESDLVLLSKVRESFKLIPILDDSERIYKQVNACNSIENISAEIYINVKEILNSLTNVESGD